MLLYDNHQYTNFQKAGAECKITWSSWKQTIIDEAEFRHFGDGAQIQCPNDEHHCDIDYEWEPFGVVTLRCGLHKLPEGKNEQGEDHAISHSCQNHPH